MSTHGTSTARIGDPLARWVSVTTGIGTAVSLTLVAVGLLLALVGGAEVTTAGGGLLDRIGDGGPGSIISVGLLALVLTPAAQLAAAAIAFARRGEHRYLVVSLLVLVLLGAGIVAATVVSRSVGG